MKRIIICADGTWNEPERISEESGRPQPTNVLKTARAILPTDSRGNHQVVYYHRGVGTGGALDKITGGAFGHGLAVNVRSIYRFIVFNYEPGDELFLFGFSRGAFTVRTLAGFTKLVGLLEKDDEFYTPELYRLYEKGIEKGTPKWNHAFRNIEGTREAPPIKFIGVWDTVGALGAPGILGRLNKKKYAYHDISLGSQIQNACQALAIDEHRKPFLPNVWERPDNWTGTLNQAWFAGVHSNVGGSYSPDGLANEALQWILGWAEACELELNDDYLSHYKPWYDTDLEDSMSAAYKLMGPVQRKLQGSPPPVVLHESVIDRIQDPAVDYSPDNVMKVYNAGTYDTAHTTRIERRNPSNKDFMPGDE